MALRSKKELDELEGPVRVVEIKDVDLCACCGTHVAHTGELGLLKITACQSYKGGVRVFMVAGERAVRLAQREHRQVEGGQRTAQRKTARDCRRGDEGQE